MQSVQALTMAVIVTFYKKRQVMSNSGSDHTSNQLLQGIKDSAINRHRVLTQLSGQSNAHLPDAIYDMVWDPITYHQ